MTSSVNEEAKVTFVLPPAEKGKPRIIIAGLDPPANSTPGGQHENHTSKVLAGKLGNADFDWIDFSKRCVVGGGNLNVRCNN